MELTREDLQQVINSFTFEQLEQAVALAKTKTLKLCPHAVLTHARTPERQIAVGITSGNELIGEWHPYQRGMDKASEQRLYLIVWNEAMLQLVYQPTIQLVGRA